MDTCPDETFIASFFEGAVSPAEEAEFRAHVAGCEECRLLVAETTKSLRDDSPPPPNVLIASERPSQAALGEVSLGRGGTFGRYLIVGVVGAGAMGVVYASYDPDLDRKVALKLLRPREAGPDDTIGQEKRLLREAQAMARLQHENVVAVYEAGTIDGQVFLAMEFVAGMSLGAWQKAATRSWQETLTAYLGAGRGLAAAHAAGLVHRDFKPDNVLVSGSGAALRVRVTDFGLARAERSGAGDTPGRSQHVPLAGASTLDLSQAGVVVGTPAYMAPEQLAGEVSDARSDQFSYAVALHEALYGIRPFPGETPEEVSTAAREGRIASPPRPPRGTRVPRERRVPNHLRQAIVRALSPDPKARFASMTEMLAALSPDGRRGRRRAALIASAAALGVIAIAVSVGYREARREETQVCGGVAHKLEGVWDAPRKHEVEAAFRATAAPFAGDALKSVEQRLDDYARRWTALRRDACEDTLLRHEATDRSMSLRYACLDDRLQKSAALVSLFTEADAKIVEHAVDAVESLPTLDGCDNVEALAAASHPVPAASIEKEVTAVRAEVDRASALERAGKYREGKDEATAALARAHELAYAPLEAEALLVTGRLEGQLADEKTGETLLEAASVAGTLGDDETEVRAFVARAYFVGYRQSHFASGERWLRYAQTPLARLGTPDAIEAERVETLGIIEWSEGKLEPALADLEKARGLWDRAYGPRNARVARSLDGIAVVYMDMGRYQDALTIGQQAAAISEEDLGAQHPELALELNNVGNALWYLGRYPEALPALRRALSIWTTSLGKDSAEQVAPLDSLGSVLTSMARYAEADDALERARALLEHTGDVHGPEYAGVLNDLGLVWRRRGDVKHARELHEQARDVLIESVGATHADVGSTDVRLAETYLLDRAFPAARELATQGTAIIEAALGARSPALAAALTVRGEAELGAADTSAAVTTLTRALEMRDPAGTDVGGQPDEEARTRFALARALWPHGDRDRALDLARQADTFYATAPWYAAEHAATQAWLTGRPKR
jgi:tetratricopeptide (TPR) repeat protein